MLRQAGGSPSKLDPRTRRNLIFQHSFCEEMSPEMLRNKPDSQKRITSIIQKYRCRYSAARLMKSSRNRLLRRINMFKRRSIKLGFIKVRKSIIGFFERDDVSRTCPGKRDYVKDNGMKVQKRYLKDYLINLHKKFLDENPSVKVSYSAFCKMKPRHIILVKYTNRNICLCVYHQNFSLKLQSLKKKNIISNVDPDEYVRVFSNEETTQHLSQLPTETDVTFSQWSRVQQEDGKKRMKLINETLPVPEFVNLFICEDKSFREHVKCVKNQQHEQRELKKKSGTS